MSTPLKSMMPLFDVTLSVVESTNAAVLALHGRFCTLLLHMIPVWTVFEFFLPKTESWTADVEGAELNKDEVLVEGGDTRSDSMSILATMSLCFLDLHCLTLARCFLRDRLPLRVDLYVDFFTGAIFLQPVRVESHSKQLPFVKTRGSRDPIWRIG